MPAFDRSSLDGFAVRAADVAGASAEAPTLLRSTPRSSRRAWSGPTTPWPAVAQGRVDWGVAIAPVAAAYDLGFVPLVDERYDFIVLRARANRAPVRRFVELLRDPGIRARLAALGFPA